MKYTTKLFKFLFIILLAITLFIIFSDKIKTKLSYKSEHDMEGFDMDDKNKRQKLFKISRDYYFNRIYKPELLTDNEIGKSINKCRIINETQNCELLTEDLNCGYCHINGTFLYGNENGVLGPTGEPLVNGMQRLVSSQTFT